MTNRGIKEIYNQIIDEEIGKMVGYDSLINSGESATIGGTIFDDYNFEEKFYKMRNIFSLFMLSVYISVSPLWRIMFDVFVFAGENGKEKNSYSVFKNNIYSVIMYSYHFHTLASYFCLLFLFN